MKALLIAANTERINLPTLPLGPVLVAEAARAAGHDVEFLDLMGEQDPATSVRTAVEAVRPQAIGVSVRNIDDQEMANPAFLLEAVRPVIAACRSASAAPIILGGAGFSMFPGPTLRYLRADYGVCGEGELAFPALLARLAAGGDPRSVTGVITGDVGRDVRRARIACLDAVPPPGRELWATSDLDDPEVWVPVQTRRGCPFRCSYCSTPLLEGGVLRRRSPRLVAEQLADMAAAGVRRIQFVDNVFNIPKGYALELCQQIQSLSSGLEWQAIIFPRGVDDELARAMADAGCVQVSLGFEAGDDRMLRAYGRRFDTAEVRRVSELFRVHGIRRFGFLMLGGPGETRETVTASFDFAQSLDLDLLKVTVGVRIYPETRLAATAIERGVIQPNDDLLHPRFFMTPGLEGWIRSQLRDRGL